MIFVGVDWAEAQHDVRVLDAAPRGRTEPGLQTCGVAGPVGHGALELGILLIQLLQTHGVVGHHGAVVISLEVPGRLGDLELATDLGDVVALVEQHLDFGEFSDHLFGGVMPLVHAVLLAPFWSIRTRITCGSVHGDPATAESPSRTNQPHIASGPYSPSDAWRQCTSRG